MFFPNGYMEGPINFTKSLMMMMNCFCGMIDQWKAFSLISSWDHCQGSSPLQISNRLQGFELVQNLSSGFVEWSCAVYYVLWMKFCSTLCSILCSINWPNFIAWFQFMGYWSKCVLQLFVNQIVKSSIWKLTLSF